MNKTPNKAASNGREIMREAARLQMSLGEALFRAKNLNALVNKNMNLERRFTVSLEKLIATLDELSHLYRHNIADELDSSLKDKS